MVLDVQNADIGRAYAKVEFDLGALYQDSLGNLYRYVLYNEGDGAVAGVAGQLVVGLDSAFPLYEVTMDYDSSTIPALANRPIGFLQAALTDVQFGFVQTRGKNRIAALTDNGVSQGDDLMKHATTDGGLDTHTGDPAILGTALEDDTGTVLAIGEVDIKID